MRRDPLDFTAGRQAVFQSALEGLHSGYPIENERYRLELSNADYVDPDHYSLAEQKRAILERRTLGRRIKADWSLVDKASNAVVDSKHTTVATVPYMTPRGTFILGGNEYTVSNQLRLRPGVYTRFRQTGEPEAHFNITSGGPSFRVVMDPETAVFSLHTGQAKLPLLPLLQAMGVSDAAAIESWGRDIFYANELAAAKKDKAALNKAWHALSRSRAMKAEGSTSEQDFSALLQNFRLDPDVSQRTLGQPFDAVTPDAVVAASHKLLQLHRGAAQPDNRDSLEFQDAWDVSQLLRERFSRDSGRVGHKALWRATLRNNLKGMHSGALDSQVAALFQKSGLGMPLEETNLLDALDQNTRVLRIGDGGMSLEAVPDSARNVQGSHFLFIDPIRGPESNKLGVDSRLAHGVVIGSDHKLYAAVRDRTGRRTYITPEQAAAAVVAFPGEVERSAAEGRKRLAVMRGGEMTYATPDEIDYFAPSHTGMLNFNSNLVPLASGLKGGRLLMGAKMLNQALPLEHGEAPLVQSKLSDSESFEHAAGKYLGAARAQTSGVVTAVEPGRIVIRDAAGEEVEHEIYDNFPLNRKTFSRAIPVVGVGDDVRAGDLVARSNMTDDSGTAALGTNLSVAWLPYPGNHEDSIVLSESAARRLSSEHMYTEKMDIDSLATTDRNKYVSLFPTTFTRSQLENIGSDGMARRGAVLQRGDPVILAVRRRTSKGAGMLHRGSKDSFSDVSTIWEHDYPGEVTDTWTDGDALKVAIKGFAPLEPGDKIAGIFGNKHIVSKIISDDKMPHDAAGNAVDAVVNPLGIISRVNPNLLIMSVLGKIAKKTGKPYVLDAFSPEDLAQLAITEMERHGISDTEDVSDPKTGRVLPRTMVGNNFYMKLAHVIEAKSAHRGTGAYTQEGQPARSPDGDDKPKRVGLGEMSGLIAHGAVANIRELRNIKGQRNDDFWNAYIKGIDPPSPGVPNSYKKVLAMMKGAGINVEKDGNYMHLTAMTNRDIDNLSSGAITAPDLVRWTKEYGRGSFGEQSMEPVKGGLFDRGITGGHGGNRFSHIELNQVMPQPVMEEPIRRLLGMTKKRFEAVLSGADEISGIGSGPAAIRSALRRIDVAAAAAAAGQEARGATSAQRRDDAIKRLKFLEAMAAADIKPADLMVDRMLVIPPIFRPVTATSKFTLVAGPNKLYMDVMRANNNLKEIEGVMDGEPLQHARLQLYNAMKAVTGLGDPVTKEHQKQGVRGLLKDIFGSSPKAGLWQRTLIGTPVDFAGRTTITSNPDLTMDEIGLPEDQAWDLFAPFVIRRLVRGAGNTPESRADAVRQVAARTAKAKAAMLAEMETRPVLATRAPALHKYSIMAQMPKLSSSRGLELNPSVLAGYGADFDGDTMNFHVVTTDDAVREAKERMLPSSNIRSPADFKVMFGPRQEFLHGLYLASTKKDGTKSLPKFGSKDEVLQAYSRGEVDISDVVSL